MSELVLTYGAGGAQGAPVAHGLLDAGFRVRAMVRHPERLEALKAAGAEVVAGDLSDPDAVRAATHGVDRVFLMLPFSGGGNPVVYARNAIQAAKEAGVRRLVLNTSGQTPPEPTGLPMLDYRLAVEALLRGSGLNAVTLRPTAYMENFLGPWVLPRLRAEGVLAYPVEQGRRVSWMAAGELGRVAVEALRRDDLAGHAYDVGGPEALDSAGVEAAFSSALGRPVRYEAISPEAFGKLMAGILGPQAEEGVVSAYRRGAEAPPEAMVVQMDGVRRDLNVPPTTLEEWVRAHAHAFAPAPA